MRTRVGLLLALVMSLGACSGGPSATSVLPSSTPVAGQRPPACVEANLLFDPALPGMLLANCVDQVAGADAEQLWAWDGSDWALVDADGPEPMVVTGGAFDTARGVLVRYGGLPLDSNDCNPETWEWDREGWRLVDAAPTTACDHMALTYDAARGVTLLFGGGDDDQNLKDETWTWNGEAWVLVSEGGPAGRAHFGLVDEPAHEQVFLYGGYDGGVLDDFWSWDGATWTELDLGTSPGARSHFGMAASPDGLLLFGGAKTSASFASLTDETWFLTNGRWSVLDGAGPSPRGSPTLGYDVERDVMVLYGGFDSEGNALADTWEWDGEWRCVDGCSVP